MALDPSEAWRLYRAHNDETERIRARLGLPPTYVPIGLTGAFVDSDPGGWRWPDGTVQRELPVEVLDMVRAQRRARGSSFLHSFVVSRPGRGQGRAVDPAGGLRLTLED